MEKNKHKQNTQAEEKKIREIFQYVKALYLKYKPILFKPLSTFSALLIGIAIGIAPIWYNNYSNEPELVGRLLVVSTATGGMDRADFPDLKSHIVHTVFLSIANKRKTPVSVIDYSISLFKDNKLIYTGSPIYLKDDTVHGIVNLGFKDFIIRIKSSNQNLLYNTHNLITPENPISGYIFFDGGLISKYDSDWNKIEITLIDAFGKEYSIDNDGDELRPPSLLPFLIKDLEIIKGELPN